MALENSKSLLQPDSTQAQQYRLQYSTLLSRTSQLQPPPSQLLAGAAAGGSADVVEVTKPVSSAPYIPTAKALYFDGATYVYNTGSQSDMVLGVTYGKMISFYMKPDLWDVGNKKQTIFHTYSGSFASQSFHIYLTGSNLRAEFTHNVTASYTQFNLSQQAIRGQGNGYSYIRILSGAPGNESKFFVGKGKVKTGITQLRNNITGFTTANNTEFSIGGTGVVASANFSGSIDEFLILNRAQTSEEVVGIVDRAFTANTITDRVRLYELSSTGSNTPGLLLDRTGSAATTQLPLTGSSGGTITFTNSYY